MSIQEINTKELRKERYDNPGIDFVDEYMKAREIAYSKGVDYQKLINALVFLASMIENPIANKFVSLIREIGVLEDLKWRYGIK